MASIIRTGQNTGGDNGTGQGHAGTTSGGGTGTTTDQVTPSSGGQTFGGGATSTYEADPMRPGTQAKPETPAKPEPAHSRSGEATAGHGYFGDTWGSSSAMDPQRQNTEERTGTVYGSAGTALDAGRGRMDQYQGSGEAGTGFTNFNRYLNANRGAAETAATNWMKKQQKEQDDLLAKTKESGQRTADSIRNGGAWGTSTEVYDPNDPKSKSTKAVVPQGDTYQTSAGSQIGTAAVDVVNGGGAAGLVGVDPVTGLLLGSIKARADIAEQNKQNYAAQNIADRTPEQNRQIQRDAFIKTGGSGEEFDRMNPATVAPVIAKPQGNWVSPEVAAQNAGQTYSGPTGWEDHARLLSEAQDVAARAQQLGSAEGLAAKAQQAGATAGGGVLDAALMGGTSGAALQNAAAHGNAGVDAVNKQASSLSALQSEVAGQTDKRAADWQAALDVWNAKKDAPSPAKPAAKSKGWREYTAGGGLRNFVNPQRMINTYLPGINEINFDSDKNRGTGMETMGSMEGGNSALFKSDEQNVYDSLSADELSQLEAMDPQNQRAFIEARKQKLGGG